MEKLLTEKVTNLFKGYLLAFKAYNLNNAVACYHLPCTLNTPDKLVHLKDNNDCLKEFGEIFAQLKHAKTSDIKVLKASYSLITEKLLLVCIDWEFIDEQGEVFADFCAVYHVALINDELKIINVVSHDLSNSLMLEEPLKFVD